MEEAVRIIAVISFFIIGFSHIFQPKVWTRFFINLSLKGESGSFINGFIHFPFGIMIVVFHNVWNGIPTILTVIGYGFLIKGAINFIFPNIGSKSLKQVSYKNYRKFVYGGFLFIGIGSILLVSLITK